MTKNTKHSPQSLCANTEATVPPLSWPTACLLFWPIAIGGAALDLWSKSAVFKWLSQIQEEEFSIIDGFLKFILRQNEGAAFSIFQGRTLFLISISVIALIVVIGIFFFGKLYSKVALIALACITAGIIGNLYDRLFNEGQVRDFIDVYVNNHHWPTFNVADSLLCIGVGLLIITNLISSTAQTLDPQQKEEP